MWWAWGREDSKPFFASVVKGSFALAETIHHSKSSQMSTPWRNRRKNVGYGKSCRIPSPRLTLYTAFVPLLNHLVKHLNRMKRIYQGRDGNYLLIQLPYFTNAKWGLGVGLVSFETIIQVSWFSPEWDYHCDPLPLVGYDLLPLPPPDAL